MSLMKVVFQILNAAGTEFIEPRRENGHGSSHENPTHDHITNWPDAANPMPVTGLVATTDSSDVEYSRITETVVAPGDTLLHTPAAGKAIRLHWVYAINDPVSATSTKITVKLGDEIAYLAWAISKRGVITGPIDGPLVINLSGPGNVAVTIFYEEVSA
jgi:hypothetical protein